jgi:Protein of unknown function (DUF2934)
MRYTNHPVARVREISSVRYDPMEEKAIAQLAFSYWEKRGRPLGSPEEDWFRAEREIRAEPCWTMSSSSATNLRG